VAGRAPSAAIVGALRRTLAAHGGVRLALLFGSHARGAAGPTSDVDVAILGRGLDRLALTAALSDAVGQDVDIVDLDDPGVPLLEELIRDAVVVHEAASGAGALWRSRALAQLETDRPWYGRMRDGWLAHVASKGL
jgi:predicted nucleotidyltransferase